MIHSARSRPQPNISSLLFSPGGQYSGVVSDDTSQSAVNSNYRRSVYLQEKPKNNLFRPC